jgi:hypothetical protein
VLQDLSTISGDFRGSFFNTENNSEKKKYRVLPLTSKKTSALHMPLICSMIKPVISQTSLKQFVIVQRLKIQHTLLKYYLNEKEDIN